MLPFLLPAAEGFGLGASLIIAIGAQNAYVLRQGLARRHVWPLVALCALADAALILLGVAGLGPLVQASRLALAAISWGGAAFLAWYGLSALRRALRPGALDASGNADAGLSVVLAKAAAFTFLNPHVYLDTVVLLGGLSAGYEGAARLAYGAGAALASFVWFFALGYGARLLEPVFANPAAWRVLDVIIGLVMAMLAISLVHRLL